MKMWIDFPDASYEIYATKSKIFRERMVAMAEEETAITMKV